MGTKHYLFPNADIAVTFNFPVGISPNYWDCIQDSTSQSTPDTTDDATTYVAAGAGTFQGAFGLTDLPSDFSGTINYVKVYLRTLQSHTSNTWNLGFLIDSVEYKAYVSNQEGYTSWTWANFTWNTNPKDSSTWTKVVIDAMGVLLYGVADKDHASNFSSVYVEVDSTISVAGAIFTHNLHRRMRNR